MNSKTLVSKIEIIKYNIRLLLKKDKIKWITLKLKGLEPTT